MISTPNDKNNDPDLEQLLTNPDYYFWQIEGETALFANMTRDSYFDSIFTDQRILAANPEIISVPLPDLVTASDCREDSSEKVHYIFHMAHCGSTLLARALDTKTKNIVYREPMVLRQLAMDGARWFSAEEQSPAWLKALEMAGRMLSKNYHTGGPAIVKANVPVNFILPQILAMESTGCSILLYSTLENYLLSILKSSGHRQWVSNISSQLSEVISHHLNISVEDHKSLSVPQLAGCLWLVQINLFTKLCESFPRVKTLDSEILFQSPKPAIKNAFKLYGQKVKENKINQIVKSELFTRYSKDPNIHYSNIDRVAEKRALGNAIQSDLSVAQDWVSQWFNGSDVPKKLPNPLV